MEQPTVAIIGAGISGLTCAFYLQKKGISFQIIEADTQVGGRVKTEHYKGYLLDRGFQVLLTNYPELKQVIDLKAIHAKPFRSGATIYTDEKILEMDNPFENPASIFSMLFSPIGSLTDKVKVYQLIRKVASFKEEELLRYKGTDTLTFLRQYGFSEKFIDLFFKPFFGGVFLEFDLKTSSRFFQFVFKQFFEGKAVLPANGIGDVPKYLAAQLPEEIIRLQTKVEKIEGKTIWLQDGTQMTPDHIVVATDADFADTLLDTPTSRTYLDTVCSYFSADVSPSPQKQMLSLLARPNGIVRHWCVPSDIQPNYAPEGKSLISVTTTFSENLEATIKKELLPLLGEQVHDWTYLKSYNVRKSLSFFPAGSQEAPFQVNETTWRCGDYLLYPSLNAAMKSGRQVAEAIADKVH